MAVGTEVGMRTSVAPQLVDVLEISQIQVWKSASRFGDLPDKCTGGAILREKYKFVSGPAHGGQWLGCVEPFTLAWDYF